jgi:hypothetical protein
MLTARGVVVTPCAVTPLEVRRPFLTIVRRADVGFFGVQRPDRVDEPTREYSCGLARAALYSWHADQHKVDIAAVKQITQLLNAGKTEPIDFIEEDQAHRRQWCLRTCCWRD